MGEASRPHALEMLQAMQAFPERAYKNNDPYVRGSW
jgi:hypothetical protein